MGGADFALLQAAKYLGIEIEILAAYDNWPIAVDVYNRNLPPHASVLDIKTLDSLPPCDFVFGGPPCVSWTKAGNLLRKDDPRDCSDKTWELVQGRNYLLENVTTIFNSPNINRFRASEYGDATVRSRTFHSNVSLSDPPVLYPKTCIGDIRDYKEDERKLAKKGNTEKAGNHSHYKESDVLLSFTAHSWHGHDIRGGGKLLPLMIRNHSTSTRPYSDDEPLGNLVTNTWHGNSEKLFPGCRNPSLLEMQRAHSFPDSWDWGKITKVNKGKLIANSWPIKMGTSVFISFLTNLLQDKRNVL